MISNGEEWHYLAVKELSALLKGIKSKNNGDFYCLYSLHLVRTKKWNHIKKACENKDFCNISMPSEEAKILEFTQYQKSDNVSFYKLCRSWMFNRKDWWMWI